MRIFLQFSARFLRIIWLARGVVIILWLCLVIGAAAITYVENIPFGKALYFSFVTGLTIGYGDIVVKTPFGKVIAILIALIGVIFTGLIVAAAVESVRKTFQQSLDHR